jgi:hypothetical protein
VFELAVVGFDPVVLVAFDVVPGCRHRFVEYAWVARCFVGDHRGRVTFKVASTRWKSRVAASPSRRVDTSTPMTWRCWSTAWYTYRHTPLTVT